MLNSFPQLPKSIRSFRRIGRRRRIEQAPPVPALLDPRDLTLGFRVDVVESTTHEEANSRLGPWIAQRSRWLKGYAQTWVTHMRRPGALWRDLGPRGFFGFQAILLGGLVAYFGLPVFWTVWLSALAGAGPDWLAEAPPWAFGALATLHLSAWGATFIAAVLAARRRGLGWLAPWTPTLFLYWPIGAAAAALALAELALAPFHWRKTRHGVGRIAARLRAEALAARPAAQATRAASPSRNAGATAARAARSASSAP